MAGLLRMCRGRLGETCKPSSVRPHCLRLMLAKFMIPIFQSAMTSVWAVLDMLSTLENLMRYTTRKQQPNISTQLSRWRWSTSQSGEADAIFEETINVALDRKATSQIMEERVLGREIPWSQTCG